MKNLKKILLLSLSICLAASLFARAPERFALKSDSMNKDIQNVIVLPDSYEASDAKFPVIYLLHGFGGNQNMWIDMRPDLTEVANKLQLIFVMPDGSTSWYWDCPAKPEFKYETYVAKELVAFVDKNYKTKASAKGRAITGLSMGGHGAIWLAMNHPEVFGACGSQSGGVDIKPFPKNWKMAENLGDFENNKEVWSKYTLIDNIEKIKAAKLAMIIDCGTEDFFYQVNEAFHKKLLENKIQHDYITRPGAHNGEYWKNSVDYQILFFKKFFDRK